MCKNTNLVSFDCKIDIIEKNLIFSLNKYFLLGDQSNEELKESNGG